MRSPFARLFLSMKELKTPLPCNPALALIRDEQWELGQVISVCSTVTTLNVINFRVFLTFYYFVENN